MKKHVFVLVVAALSLSVPVSYAQALLRGGIPPHVPGELIIQFTPAVTDGDIAAAFQQGRLNLLEHIQTAAMRADGKIGLTRVSTGMPLDVALDVLSRLPGIDFAELHAIGELDYVPDDPFYLDGSLWGTYSDDLPSPLGPQPTTNPFGSQVEKLWAAGYIGSSDVYVGVVDTGFQPDHPDLAANLWTNPDEVPGDGLDNDLNGYIDDVHGWNTVANTGSTFNLLDDDSHGTHVAGTIGAAGGNGIGVAGMNWNVKLISAKIMAAGPGIQMLDAIEGIDYMVALKQQKGLNIVALNNSWSFGGISLALQDALTRAAQAGILVVCSASNANSDNDAFPRSPASLDTTAGAGFDAVVCVAAIDAAGNKATFSNYGLYSVDLGAPGVNIISTVPDAEPPNGALGGYNPGNGTSMATPHVTGAIALYASIFPNATASDIKKQLLTAGVSSTPSLNGTTLTAGRLDAYALVTGTPTPVSLPAAPGSLTATVPKGYKGVVNLAWTDLANNERGFAIERKTSTGTVWQMVATVPANTRTYSNSGLAPRTTYNYRVRAFNVAGSSSYSNQATIALR